jgi:hypothetical protein
MLRYLFCLLLLVPSIYSKSVFYKSGLSIVKKNNPNIISHSKNRLSDNPGKLLFIVEQSINTNIVVYEANFQSNGKLDAEKPLKVYWILNEKGKKVEDVTYLEWKFAYGYDYKINSQGDFILQMKAFQDRTISIFKSNGNSYYGLIKIAGKIAKLEKIYVKCETSWTGPKIYYAELIGKEINTGTVVKEKIYKD